jgi:integrase
MSVRKRTWTSPKGEAHAAWVADYVNGRGVRRRKSFERKREAESFLLTASTEVRKDATSLMRRR